MSTDDMVRRLARVHDDELRGLAQGGPARRLLGDITALPPGRSARARTSHRKMIMAVVAAAVVAAAGVTAVTGRLGGSGDDVRLAAAVRITRAPAYYEARIIDPHADEKRFAAAFAKYGLHITVMLLPVSPHVVGTVVFEDEDERARQSESEGAGIKMIYDRACRTASGGDCSIGLRIPLSFKGHATVEIGRQAEPGERYASTSPKDGYQGLRGLTVARAEAALAKDGLRVGLYNVYWPGWGTSWPRTRIPSNWRVSSDALDPYSPGTVRLPITAQGPMPPDVVAEMRRGG